MTPEEAVLQLELIGHDFFCFRNVESNDVNVVYRRRDGNYGLIEPVEAGTLSRERHQRSPGRARWVESGRLRGPAQRREWDVGRRSSRSPSSRRSPRASSVRLLGDGTLVRGDDAAPPRPCSYASRRSSRAAASAVPRPSPLRQGAISVGRRGAPARIEECRAPDELDGDRARRRDRAGRRAFAARRRRRARPSARPSRGG